MMPPRPWLMGIVNATPDSFSDGGRSFEATVRHALQLLEDGADILDIGGESTRPGAGEVPVAEELDRVMPVLTELKKLPKLKICTTKNALNWRHKLFLQTKNLVCQLVEGKKMSQKPLDKICLISKTSIIAHKIP